MFELCIVGLIEDALEKGAGSQAGGHQIIARDEGGGGVISLLQIRKFQLKVFDALSEVACGREPRRKAREAGAVRRWRKRF